MLCFICRSGCKFVDVSKDKATATSESDRPTPLGAPFLSKLFHGCTKIRHFIRFIQFRYFAVLARSIQRVTEYKKKVPSSKTLLKPVGNSCPSPPSLLEGMLLTSTGANINCIILQIQCDAQPVYSNKLLSVTLIKACPSMIFLPSLSKTA